MKVLVILALAALAAAEAEPEADPQLLLNAGFPMAPWSPIVSVKSEEAKPITYTVPSAYPFSSWPYMHGHYNTWPYLLPAAGKPAESARAKREADPQLLMNTGLYPWATPYSAATPYAFGAHFAATAGAFPYAAAAGAYPYAYNPLVPQVPIISTPGAIRTVSTTAEGEVEVTAVARKKREAEAEADPQFLVNPLTYSFPTASGIPAVSPLTYSAGAWPAAWGGAWPATWSGAWPHSGLPIAYTLAKKTE